MQMDKRKKILESALKLFVEFGFHGTPTSKIAANAGVSNGTLFHYFGTKEELIKELYIAVKEELNSFLSSKINASDSMEEVFRKFYQHSIYWGLDNKEKFHYVQQVHFSPHIFQIPESVLQEQLQLHLGLIEQAKATKVIKNLPTNLVYTLMLSHVNGIYTYVLHLPANKRKAVIDDGFAMIWDMFTE